MTDRKPKELMLSDGLPIEMRVEIGNDQRLFDPESLEKMVETCEKIENKTQNGSNL